MLFERNFVQNGDDCLTVGNGGKDIIFRSTVVDLCSIHTDLLERDSYCEGGHGLSIGSLGKGGQVANVQNVLSAPHVSCVMRWISHAHSCLCRIENVTMVCTIHSDILFRLTWLRSAPSMVHGLRVGQVEMVWPGSALWFRLSFLPLLNTRLASLGKILSFMTYHFLWVFCTQRTLGSTRLSTLRRSTSLKSVLSMCFPGKWLPTDLLSPSQLLGPKCLRTP